MEALLHELAHYVALSIEGVGILVIAIGAIEALYGVVRVMLTTQLTDSEKEELWLRFARWLVTGLTFQVAADIVHTAIAPTWQEIGHLAAIAVIRTFISYFLDRDIEKVRDPEVIRPNESKRSSET